MKLDVPFYPQTTKLNCGPAALRMVLSYLDKDPGLAILEEKTGIKEGKGLSTIKIAIAAASLDFKTELISKNIGFNPLNAELDFYKNYSDTNASSMDASIQQAKNLGVVLQEKSIQLKEVLSLVSKDSIPIILLDWNIIKGTKEKGYQGHFVPIVGHDNENVIVHNHDMHSPTPFLSIKKALFEEARQAVGTDEDIVIIHRKHHQKT